MSQPPSLREQLLRRRLAKRLGLNSLATDARIVARVGELVRAHGSASSIDADQLAELVARAQRCQIDHQRLLAALVGIDATAAAVSTIEAPARVALPDPLEALREA